MKTIKNRKERLKIIKRNKKVLIITGVIILILTTLRVSAGTQDSSLVNNQIDGYYAIAKLSDGTHLYNLDIYKVNGKTAYCIEIGTKIETHTYNSTTNLTASGLSQAQISYIKKIMYYGYDYKNHNDYKYYMAAQEMIWEYLNNIEVYWTTEEAKTGAALNIDKYKDEIANLIKQNDVVPSINGQSYKIIFGRDVNTIDYNNVLRDFEITTEKGEKVNYILVDSPNEPKVYLNIKSDEIYSEKTKLVMKKKNYYSNDSVLYYVGSSQKLMSVGKIDMPTAYIYIQFVPGTLTVKLVDSETKTSVHQGQATLTGATYELYDEKHNLVETFTTEEGKDNVIENLTGQTYYIKQVSPSEGYNADTTTTELVMYTYTKKITLEEQIIKKDLEIFKIYGKKNNNEFAPENNIKFNIYDNNHEFYQTVTTNEDGFAKATLLYGEYTIEQENSTVGYNKVDDFKLKIDNTINEKIRYNLFDTPIKVKINVHTLDEDTNKNIEQNTIKYKIKDASNNSYVSYNGEEIFLTDEYGNLLIPTSLEYGTYILEQITPPTNYQTNNETLTIKIDENSGYILNDENEFILDVNYYNKLIKGIVHITTKEEIFNKEENNYSYTEKIKDNTEVEIYAKEDIVDSNETIYKKGDIIETLTTDDKGKVDTKELYLGEYCVREKLNPKVNKCFKVEYVDSNTNPVEVDVTLLSKITKYNVKLTNLDKNDGSQIKGSVIKLYTDSNELINTSITNNEGIIKIQNLPEGKYYFLQTSVPNNYILNKEKISFEIVNDNVDLIIKNEKNKQKNILLIPNTLSNNKNILEIISLIFIITGLIIYVYKKKSRNHIN